MKTTSYQVLLVDEMQSEVFYQLKIYGNGIIDVKYKIIDCVK